MKIANGRYWSCFYIRFGINGRRSNDEKNKCTNNSRAWGKIINSRKKSVIASSRAREVHLYKAVTSTPPEYFILCFIRVCFSLFFYLLPGTYRAFHSIFPIMKMIQVAKTSSTKRAARRGGEWDKRKAARHSCAWETWNEHDDDNDRKKIQLYFLCFDLT